MTKRILPLACAVWMLAIFVAAPYAAQNAPSSKEVGPKPPTGHLDLGLFTHSENCVACHNNLSTATGEDVSIGTTWRSTMMANSARDPYWHAGVRRESIDHPEHSGAIQDECAACHMPMTTRIYRAAGGEGQVFSHLPIVNDDDSEFHRLAADGISCTVCHQIAPDKLGTRESFNSSFVTLPTPKSGARLIFGPYQVDKGRKTVMRSNSGFEQAKGDHVTKSELCASCHTLITQAFGPNGEVIAEVLDRGEFGERTGRRYDLVEYFGHREADRVIDYVGLDCRGFGAECDQIVENAVTNALLSAYVLFTGQWQYWM